MVRDGVAPWADAEAVVDGDPAGSTSRRCARLVDGGARALIVSGIDGATVCVWAPNSLEWIVAVPA